MLPQPQEPRDFRGRTHNLVGDQQVMDAGIGHDFRLAELGTGDADGAGGHGAQPRSPVSCCP